jgi:hypothetical protein
MNSYFRSEMSPQAGPEVVITYWLVRFVGYLRDYNRYMMNGRKK